MNKNQGFSPKYAAVLLVLVVVASAATILLSRSTTPAQETAVEEALVENLAESTQSTLPSQTSNVSAVSAPSASSDRVESAAEAMSVQSAAQEDISGEVSGETVLQTALPVSGNAISDYAMDCLSYNETTRDWRIHNGIDLAAESGESVCAAADGTVYTTYEDDSLGYTVVIRHDGGYTTRYSSLSEDLCVQAGDEVKLGQTIGYASDTALVETVMGSHVHFSVSCQDESIDPADFLNLG